MYYINPPRMVYQPQPQQQGSMSRPRARASIPPVENQIIDRPQRRSKSQPTSPQYDIISVVVLVSFIPLGISIAMESVAYNEDAQWNRIVEQEIPFPLSTTIDYFNGHTITLNPARPNHDDLQAALLRNDYLEPAALFCMALSAVAVVLAYFLYLQGEAMQNTLVATHIMAAFLMMIASILIFVSDSDIDKSHLRSAAELDIVLQTLLEEHRNPASKIPLEEIEMASIQTINLIAIEKTCALGATHHGRFSGSSSAHYTYLLLDKHNLKRLTMSDLRQLRFCSREDYKHTAAIMAIIYSGVCLLIPFLFCWMERGKLKVYDETNNQTKQQNTVEVPPIERQRAKPATQPPPAYGYGYPAPQNTDRSWSSGQQYDPRSIPKTPVIPLDELLELEYTQLALLHKHAKKIAGEGDDDDFESDIGSQRPTRGRRRRSKDSGGRGQSSKKKKRNSKSAERIAELEKKIENLEKKVNRVEERAQRSASAPRVKSKENVSKKKEYSSELVIRKRNEDDSSEED